MKDAAFPVEPQLIRDVFVHPRVTDSYVLNWREPDFEGVVGFLCGEKDFSEERVQKALSKATDGMKESKKKTTLEAWF